jgi:hypothetical protein
MSTPLELNEILLSIADSLSQAQQQLNDMPSYDIYGRPTTIYQLPYLDFNIALAASYDSEETTDTEEDPPENVLRPFSNPLRRWYLNLMTQQTAMSKAVAVKSR